MDSIWVLHSNLQKIERLGGFHMTLTCECGCVRELCEQRVEVSPEGARHESCCPVFVAAGGQS